MGFEFSSYWRPFNVFWRTLGTLLSFSSLLRETMGGIESYIKLLWHSQKFILCGSPTFSALMGQIISHSLVSIQFQAPLLPVDGVSSSPVQWVALAKGWGSSRHHCFQWAAPLRKDIEYVWWQSGSGLKAGRGEPGWLHNKTAVFCIYNLNTQVNLLIVDWLTSKIKVSSSQGRNLGGSKSSLAVILIEILGLIHTINLIFCSQN